MIINCCSGTLGDLYNKATCRHFAFGNNRVVATHSMPLQVNLFLLHGRICWGKLIIVPPLSLLALSYLIATWLFCTTGVGYEGVSHVSQKQRMLACFRQLSCTMSGSFAIIDLIFNNDMVT